MRINLSALRASGPSRLAGPRPHGLLPKTGRANPLLSKEGQARSAGVARSVSPIGRNIKNCSKSRSYLIDAREALLINRYCSPLNRPPQPSLCEGIPALLRRGMALKPGDLENGHR